MSVAQQRCLNSASKPANYPPAELSARQAERLWKLPAAHEPLKPNSVLAARLAEVYDSFGLPSGALEYRNTDTIDRPLLRCFRLIMVDNEESEIVLRMRRLIMAFNGEVMFVHQRKDMDLKDTLTAFSSAVITLNTLDPADTHHSASESGKPILVLLDYNLNGFKGPDLIDEYRKSVNNTEYDGLFFFGFTTLMAGAAPLEIDLEYRQRGAPGVLDKDLPMNNLFGSLEELIERHAEGP